MQKNYLFLLLALMATFVVLISQSPLEELLIYSLVPVKAKVRRLTNVERSQFSLPKDLKDILIGLFLGDLCGRKLKSYARLLFEQGSVHQEYILHLYELFKSYCGTAPRTTNRLPDKITGKIHSRIAFETFSLSCFNELYELFYPFGKKVVPQNIAELLTPLGLAY